MTQKDIEGTVGYIMLVVGALGVLISYVANLPGYVTGAGVALFFAGALIFTYSGEKEKMYYTEKKEKQAIPRMESLSTAEAVRTNRAPGEEKIEDNVFPPYAHSWQQTDAAADDNAKEKPLIRSKEERKQIRRRAKLETSSAPLSGFSSGQNERDDSMPNFLLWWLFMDNIFDSGSKEALHQDESGRQIDESSKEEAPAEETSQVEDQPVETETDTGSGEIDTGTDIDIGSDISFD